MVIGELTAQKYVQVGTSILVMGMVCVTLVMACALVRSIGEVMPCVQHAVLIGLVSYVNMLPQNISYLKHSLSPLSKVKDTSQIFSEFRSIFQLSKNFT
jgi:hypothetical protein